jgi:hypothetical protein
MAPIVNGLETEFGSSLKVQRLDAAEPAVAALQGQLDVRGHPSFVILDNAGSPVSRASGPQTAASLRSRVQAVLMP